jgi:hypothetical protein
MLHFSMVGFDSDLIVFWSWAIDQKTTWFFTIWLPYEAALATTITIASVVVATATAAAAK